MGSAYEGQVDRTQTLRARGHPHALLKYGRAWQNWILWLPLLGLYHVLGCILIMELGTQEAQGAFADGLWTQSLITESTSWGLYLLGHCGS